MGQACAAPWRSRTATDASLWRHCALSSSMRANWRSRKPPRRPWPKSRKPTPWPTTGSGDRRGGLSVGLPPKPLWRSMRAEARAAEAAVHAPGAIMRSAITSSLIPAVRAAPVGDVLRKQPHQRQREAIAW
jgi:hypothetical protein